jgi:hypothetical protein
LVAPLKFIYSSVQVSDLLVLTVYCKLINFLSQTFPLFIPEMFPGCSSDYPNFLHLDPVTAAI